jgi:glutathione S-transferase
VLAYLETAIPTSGFLVEDRITLADLAVATGFVNLAHIGCPVDAAAYPRTAAYVSAILARPSFAPWVAREKAMLGG